MFRTFALLSVVTGALAMGSRSLAQEPPKAAPAVVPLNSVSMEVSALQTLYELNFTKAQLEKLQQLAVGTAPKDEKRKAGKASKEYRAKLLLLRKALVEAKDNPQIAKLQVELEIMRDRENPFFDDGVNVTDSARKRAGEALRLLKPSQLAQCIAHIADDVGDPQEQMLNALEEVRALSDEEWQEQRDEITSELGKLVGGLDAVKAKKVSEQVGALLVRARGLSKADFAKQQVELKKAGRSVVGETNALEVVRHQVEMELARLLSNPRLPQAIRARLK